MTFNSDSDKYLTINALRLAAAKYDEYAASVAFAAENSRAHLAMAFKRQAAQARRIADTIENSEEA